MTVKLFTIGDSISQGFMSGAAANTHLCYSTILAKVMGIDDYRHIEFKDNLKFKFDIELILRTLEKNYGNDIFGLEWFGVFQKINQIFDKSEDYFERGGGKIGIPIGLPHDSFHNVAVEGMDVADAWMVTPEKAMEIVNGLDSKKTKDGFLSTVSEPFCRNAFRVLNPNAKDDYKDYSPVRWLKHHAEESGVENAIVWLGANNALGTVISLDPKPTPGDGVTTLESCLMERRKWNLWHPADFEAEYTVLLDKIYKAMANNLCDDWHCFLGTVPLVTIAPIIKGLGEPRLIPDPAGSGREFRYYQYYTYFPLSMEAGFKINKILKFSQALFIDKTIIRFNELIMELAKKKNQQLGRDAFHIVDISQSLTDMAWKRNSGNPTYEFPEYVKWKYPLVDTKYYHADKKGKISKGGVFSLDGVHPTAIGQGLVAWEFLKKMQEKGRVRRDADINWEDLYAVDALRQMPIRLMQEIYQHDKLIQLFADICEFIGVK